MVCIGDIVIVFDFDGVVVDYMFVDDVLLEIIISVIEIDVMLVVLEDFLIDFSIYYSYGGVYYGDGEDSDIGEWVYLMLSLCEYLY